MSLQQEKIAYYLRLLLDRVKDVNDRLANKENDNRFLDLPPVPYAGSATALDPQRFEIIEVKSVGDRLFRGVVTNPIENKPHFEEEKALLPLEDIIVPEVGATPEVGDFVPVLFTGIYETSAGVEGAKYAYPWHQAPCPGIIVSQLTGSPNVYEVEIYRNASFPPVPGTQVFNVGDKKQRVKAGNWATNPALLSPNEKVFVHKHNNQWWFSRWATSSGSCCTPPDCNCATVTTCYCSTIVSCVNVTVLGSLWIADGYIKGLPITICVNSYTVGSALNIIPLTTSCPTPA